MIKKVLITVGIILGLLIALGIYGASYFKPQANTVFDFIKENPERSAIKLVRNGEVIAELNPDKLMPLASTVKIIIAIEYAIQAGQERINAEEEVTLVDLEKFYVANTDGGAHLAWLKRSKDKIKDEKIPLKEVAKGMIRFSSNANTEWLSQKLGLQNINDRIDSLGISDHTSIYYIVSALFVGKERFPELKGEELEEKLRALSIEEYVETTDDIHSKLLADTSYKKDLGDLGFNIQRIWSDNLPQSTVGEYSELMRKINSKKYFDSKTHQYLDEVMEGIMQNPKNREWLEHAGMKGGSTAFVLTKAQYATDKKGNTTELAYFFNDLGLLENRRLQSSMNEFELNILSNEDFRIKLKNELKP